MKKIVEDIEDRDDCDNISEKQCHIPILDENDDEYIDITEYGIK